MQRKNQDKHRKRERNRKKHALLKLCVKNPDTYEIQKKDETERLKLHRQREKLGLVKRRNDGNK